MKQLKLLALGSVIGLTGCTGDIESLTKYTASMLCSKTFVTGQDPVDIYEKDLLQNTEGGAKFTKLDINPDEAYTTSTSLGVKSKALYRPGLGCTLVGDGGVAALKNQQPNVVPPVSLSASAPWPNGTAGTVALSGFDYQALNTAVDYHFTEHADFQIDTASVAVAYQGKLIYERYANDVGPHTPLYGFSMAKTMGTLFAGVLVKQGLLDMDNPVGLAEWQGDGRQFITSHHLLSMTSGLDWDENYDDPSSDGMDIFNQADMGAFAADKSNIYSPGSTFNYSTGDTMIFAKAIKENIFAGSLANSYSYLHSEFFRKVGINSVTIQADNSGSLVLGMQDLIGTRDLARLGQFMLQNGQWNGQQLIPANWIDYMSTPSGLATKYNIDYGAGIWLNTAQNGNRFFPSLPADTMIGWGMRGQFLLVVPSLDLVIVRMGNSMDRDTFQIVPEIDAIAAAVVNGLP